MQKNKNVPSYDDGYNYSVKSRRDRYEENQDQFEDITSYKYPKGYKPPRENTKRKGCFGGLFSKILAIVLCLVVVFVILFIYMFGGLNRAEITSDRDALGISNDTGITNIALFGVDSRSGVFEGRSDAVMVLSIDNKHEKLKLISLLRDSFVDMEISQYGQEKLTHAYAYGGAENAINTINRNYSLNITDYVTVNFSEMAKIVDAVGGVKIDVEEAEIEKINNYIYDLSIEDPSVNISDSDYLSEYGLVRLSGNQAVAYSRIRSIGGDEGRVGRQQTVLNALLDAAFDKSVFSYPQMIHDIVPHCETSLGAADMLELIPALLKKYSLETVTIPGPYEDAYGGEQADGAWVLVYDLDQAAKHIDAFIREEDSPYYYDFTD